MEKPLINIVIPLFNEEKVIAKNVEILIDFLSKTNFPYSYIITLTNNASTDKSLLVCEDLAKKFAQVRVLNLDKKGKGRAIRSAWSSGAGDVLSFMDADLSSDLNFFKPLIDAIAVERYDLAIGNRLGRTSKTTSRRIIRKVASRAYNLFIRMLFRTGVNDHQCGFKAMSRAGYRTIEKDLTDNEWFVDTEMIVMSARLGLKIKSIDIVWVDDVATKVSIGRTSSDMFRAALRLRRRLSTFK